MRSKRQSAAIVYQKRVFPHCRDFNLWPPSYNFQFSQELGFLLIVLHLKVQTLQAIKQKASAGNCAAMQICETERK